MFDGQKTFRFYIFEIMPNDTVWALQYYKNFISTGPSRNTEIYLRLT
jgi:hypothetical protein